MSTMNSAEQFMNWRFWNTWRILDVRQWINSNTKRSKRWWSDLDGGYARFSGSRLFISDWGRTLEILRRTTRRINTNKTLKWTKSCSSALNVSIIRNSDSRNSEGFVGISANLFKFFMKLIQFLVMMRWRGLKQIIVTDSKFYWVFWKS